MIQVTLAQGGIQYALCYISGIYSTDLQGGNTMVAYYKRDRGVVVLRSVMSGVESVTINGVAYYVDNERRVEVDMSDVWRSQVTWNAIIEINGVSFDVSNIISGGEQEYEFPVQNGVTPSAIIMPPIPFFPHDIPIARNSILPPSVIYNWGGLPANYMLALPSSDFYGNFNVAYQSLEIGTFRNNGQAVVARYDYNQQWVSVHTYVPVMIDACEDACMLIWEGVTGQRKAAIWKVKKVTNAADRENYIIAGNGYDSRSSREESMTVYIEGLSRYDYAYYADIVTSPYVQMVRTEEDITMLSGLEYMLGVEVEDKDITIPDNDTKLYTLEIELNTRKYGGKL